MPKQTSVLRGGVRLTLFLLLTYGLFPVQLIFILFIIAFPHLKKQQSPVVRLWFRIVLLILNVKTEIKNKTVLKSGQKIILSNHISYLDIIILGAYFDGFFVAKSDVADWPVFGILSKLAGTIFISRQKQKIKSQIEKLSDEIKRGKTLVIFPEGTTSNGRTVLPFKSGLLGIAATAPVQPVSIAYTHVNNQVLLTQQDFDDVAWHGDMTLAPHLWRLFCLKNVTVRVVVHAALGDYIDSKTLALQAQEAATNGFQESLGNSRSKTSS